MSRFTHAACILIFLTLANGKAFGNILLNVTVANVDSAYFDYGTQLIYNGVISASASGGVAPYNYTLIMPPGVNVQQRNGYFPVLSVGTYTLIATDASGQADTNTVTVSYKYPQPTVIASNVFAPGCTNIGSFTLNGSGGTPPYTYSIDGGTVYTTGNIFTNLAQGAYVILIKDANGQVGMIGTNPTSKIYPGYIGLFSTSCNVSATAQFSSSTCTDQGWLHASVFSDQPVNSFSLDGINYRLMIRDPVIADLFQYDSVGLVPGLYNFYLKDNIGNLLIYASVIIKFCSIQIGFNGTTASCGQSNGSLTVIASGGVPPYTYTMDGVNYQSGDLFTGLPSGNYAVTVKDADGLTSTSIGTLYDNCPLNLSPSTVNATCGKQNGILTVAVKGGTPPYSYSINGMNFQSTDSFPNLGQGDYTVTVKDNSGLSASASAIIATEGGPELSAVPSAASCAGNNGGIIVTGKGGILPYQYSLDSASYQDSAIFAGLAAGDYTVSVEDANGCTAAQTVTVPLNKTPAKVFAGPDTSVLINQPIPLHAVDVNNIGFSAYQWSPPDGLNDPGIPDPIASPGVSITYTVKASTPAGCEATSTISIKVFTAYGLFVPNAFTPNGDGHNDILRVTPVGIKEFKYFAVYNRTGLRVFYSTDPSAGWDGALGGVAQMTGAYIWLAGGVDYLGNRIDRKGTVLLLR